MMENIHLSPEPPNLPPPMMEIKLIRKINLSNDGNRRTLPYNFGNFFSDAESADISALDADDFTDVTLANVTLLM